MGCAPRAAGQFLQLHSGLRKGSFCTNSIEQVIILCTIWLLLNILVCLINNYYFTTSNPKLNKAGNCVYYSRVKLNTEMQSFANPFVFVSLSRNTWKRRSPKNRVMLGRNEMGQKCYLVLYSIWLCVSSDHIDQYIVCILFYFYFFWLIHLSIIPFYSYCVLTRSCSCFFGLMWILKEKTFNALIVLFSVSLDFCYRHSSHWVNFLLVIDLTENWH